MYTATIEQNRQRDYERAADFERQRLRTDEITHASERLAAPMRNTFKYELGDENELWFQGQKLSTVFDGGVRAAREVAAVYPHFSVMVTRALIEHEEYDCMRVLATGSEDEPDILVVESPIADAALAGEDFGESFDTERAKTLVRIHRRVEGGIESTSLSLDQSDRQGLQMIAKLFGVTIPDNATSEDILALRLWGYSDQLAKDPVDLMRETYDNEMKLQYGGEWYAGRKDSPVLDAKKFIEQQTDLIDQHLKQIVELKQQLKDSVLKKALKAARYDFSAAILFRAKGDLNIGLSEAGSAARDLGIEMRDDCPTGVTAAQSAESLGYSKVKRLDVAKMPEGRHFDECMNCPKCESGKGVWVEVWRHKGKKRVDYTCNNSGCGATTLPDRREEIGSRNTLRNSSVISKKSPKEADKLRSMYGEHAQIRTVISVGGAVKEVYDQRTGETITKL